AMVCNLHLGDPYSFCGALPGGRFLVLSYFGCDQSQVQRYLTAKSVDEARQSLLMSGFVKIPLQLLILASGVLVFVFYLFQTPPMLFNHVYDAQVAASPSSGEYAALARDFDAAVEARRAAARSGDRAAFLASDVRVRGIRHNAQAIVKRVTG